MERLSATHREEVRLLQAQLDEQRDKWRKEQQDSQKITKEKLSELEKAQSTIHSLQEEVGDTLALTLGMYHIYSLW